MTTGAQRQKPFLETASSPPPPILPPALLGDCAEVQTPQLQVAHVLFMDIVGFGRLRMSAQGGVQVELQAIVQETEAVRQAQMRSGCLVIRPTGDGMALVFFHDLLSPVRCAVEIANILAARADEIKERTGGQIKLRMGIHTGPVLMVEDMNGQADIAGDGIIIAQRVMDCGDVGHILLSESAAKAIEKLDPWGRWLTDLGTFRVKHGAKVHLYNLCGRTIGGPANFGNVGVPTKVQTDTIARRREVTEREARQNRFEAEEGLRPYVRSLVMMLCTAGFIGCVVAALALRSPQTLRDLVGSLEVSRLVQSTRPTPPKTKPSKQTGGVSNDPVGLIESEPRSVENGDAKPAPSAASSAARTMPDFSGMTLKQAQAAGRSAGLIVRKSKYSGYTDEQNAGRVYRQDHGFGIAYQPGELVRVAVSKGPAPEPGSDTRPAPLPEVHVSQSDAPPAPAPEPWTGIVIDASHLPSMKRYQYATVLGAEGKLYPESDADTDDGPIKYYKSLSEAKKGVCGAHPLVLKADGVVAPNGFDCSVRLSAAQINQWNEAASPLAVAQSHKVGIILPP